MTTDLLLQSLQSGLSPFLGLPARPEPCAAAGVVLGAPYDGGVLNRPGARFGPWALRAASVGLGRLPMPLRLQGHEPSAARGPAALDWVDGGNLPTLPFRMEAALAAVEDGVAAWASHGARTLLLGGDHLLTLGALRAHARRHGPLGLVHFDAHPDAGDGAAWGTPSHHGSWLRQALEEGLVAGSRCVSLGVRAPRFEAEEVVYLVRRGVRLWTPWDLRDPRLASQLAGDLARVGLGPAYVTVDLDVLDPAFCPAVAEPVPAGLTVIDLVPLLQAVHRWPEPWIGADVMELCPTLAGAEDSARVGVHLTLQLLA